MKKQITIGWMACERLFVRGDLNFGRLHNISFDAVYRHWFNKTASFLPNAEAKMRAIIAANGEANIRRIAGVK